MVGIVQLSTLSSQLRKPEPKDNNVALVNRTREKLPVLSEHVNNFVFANSVFHLPLTCSTCEVLSKPSVDHSAVQLHSVPLPHHQPSRHKVLYQSVCNHLQPWKRHHLKKKKKIKNWDSRRMERNSIYDWSTHLLELSFMPTSAYKTSTIAGSSFIYSMPFTSTCRGFPSVMSLMGDNRKVQGQFYHIVTTWSSLILMLFF